MRRLCFVIMPFSDELHYFYLYLQQHVKKKHDIDCYRADDRGSILPLMENVIRLIEQADVIIADCSGQNANVFYELGIAHAHKKKIIYITSDENTPTDVQPFQFIRYNFKDDKSFFDKLDKALNSIFPNVSDDLYERIHEVVLEIQKTTNIEVNVAEKKEFWQRVYDAALIREIPSEEDHDRFIEFFFPLIVKDNTDTKSMQSLTRWRLSNTQVH